MNDSRLIEILKTFSRDDIKSFEKFLQSPFVKSRRNIAELFLHLKKFYPEFDSPELKKEIVFRKLFPGEAFLEKKIINMMSELTKETENYLKHDALDKDEIESMLYLSKGFQNKKLFNHSLRVLTSVEKKLEPGFAPGKDYFSKFRQLTFMKSAYFTLINDFDNMIECKKNYFEVLAIQFIIDFIEIMSLKETALSTYGKNIENDFMNSIFKSFDVDKVFKLIEKTDFVNKHLIAIHYYLLKTIENPGDNSYYFLLRDLFYKNLNKLDREEKYFLFNHLASYCADEVSKKNAAFFKEALDVYKMMLENNSYSFSESEYMQVLTYRNIIYYCNIVKDTKWFGYFIEKYTAALSPQYRNDMYNFSYANLHFLMKEFEKALVSVSKIENEFFLFKADLKNLMLQIYFELGHYEQAFSMIDTYKHFLAKTKEIPYKDIYRNFVDRYLELLKIKSGQSKESPDFLRTKIEKEKNIVNKIWLLEKL